jgi:hypothetical protein
LSIFVGASSRRGRLTGALIASVATVGIAGSWWVGSSRASAGPSMCKPGRMQTTVAVPEIGSTLGAVKAEAQPTIDADEATKIADGAGYDSLGGQMATTGCAMLVDYTSAEVLVANEGPEESGPTTPVYSNQLAWIISYEGVCVPVFGPPDAKEKPECAGRVINVVVDASDGRVVESFDNPNDDTPSSLSANG